MGTAHLGESDSINANTSFHIASVSKTFTAMIVLKMWQDKQLEIDSSFTKYFPEFNYPTVTIRQLLNHRSGLPNYVYFMEELGWNKKDTIQNKDVFDCLVQKKAQLKNIAPSGTRFSYCNTNYALLALLIEKISGLPYPQYLQQYIFTPLGMKNSFVYTTDKEKTVVPSYDWRGELIPMNHLDAVYGDKNIYSSVSDLLLWDRLLASDLYLQQSILKEAYTPYSNEKPGIRNYGLGWRMNVYPDSTKLIYHNGWWHGNNSALIRMIPEDVTIIALGNRFTRSVYKVRYLTGLFGQNYLVPEEEEAESAKKN
jgi:CubicO group peptidase (beta-lactamase class C family)